MKYNFAIGAIFENTNAKTRDVDRINLKTALLDAERLKIPVKFFTRSRRFIDRFTCIDTDLKPFTLKSFVTSGDLVYYQKNRFEWSNICIDDITKIVIGG